MAGLDAGQKFPAGTTFSYIPYTEEKSDINTSGSPIDFDASKGIHFNVHFGIALLLADMIMNVEFAGKKVVLFAVPGAFTGTCSQSHLPGYIQNLAKFKELGVDSIVCIAYNDAYVMSAWGKANRVKGNDIVSLIRSIFASPSYYTHTINQLRNY